MQKYSLSGLGELETKLRIRRPSKLDKSQRAELAKLIIGFDPRQLRFSFALSTREMIAELLEREFGVVMSISAAERMQIDWDSFHNARHSGLIKPTLQQ